MGSIALGDDGAGHQLDLVEEHERQDDGADRLAGEYRIGHRHAAGEALLRTTEGDGDLVFAGEAEEAAAMHGYGQRNRQQQHVEHDDDGDIGGGEGVPEPF